MGSMRDKTNPKGHCLRFIEYGECIGPPLYESKGFGRPSLQKGLRVTATESQRFTRVQEGTDEQLTNGFSSTRAFHSRGAFERLIGG
jgi:hypothetical protein